MLNFFNLDLHISVIADIKSVLKKRVNIIDWSLSCHTWVMNRNPDKLKVINQSTWLNIDINLIENFQREYDNFLKTFDGFIVGHPNVFVLLYEKYNKPIIMINSCRYDMPGCFTKDKSIIPELNNCILRLQERGLLTIISNNLADKKYLELSIPRVKSIHIPSLCEYTGIVYSGIYNKFLLYSGESCINEHFLIKKRSELGRFKWEELGKFKGIIHIPYEASTMSIFEHISAGIPLFFPTKRFLKELWEYNKAPFQCNYWGETPEYLISTKSYNFWLDNADYYDIKGYYYFDSFEELFSLLNDFKDTKKSERLEFLKKRYTYITTFWNTIELPDKRSSNTSKINIMNFLSKFNIKP